MMKIDTKLEPIRVGGEVLALHCWACGTEHAFDIGQCVPEELPYLICSKSDCRMSLFLVNELSAKEQTGKRVRRKERSWFSAALSWFYK